VGIPVTLKDFKAISRLIDLDVSPFDLFQLPICVLLGALYYSFFKILGNIKSVDYTALYWAPFRNAAGVSSVKF